MNITIKEIESELQRYKTNSSKKAYLTRWIKQTEEYFKDVNEAFEKRTNSYYGYLYGDRIYSVDVNNALADVLILRKYKNKHFAK